VVTTSSYIDKGDSNMVIRVYHEFSYQMLEIKKSGEIATNSVYPGGANVAF